MQNCLHMKLHVCKYKHFGASLRNCKLIWGLRITEQADSMNLDLVALTTEIKLAPKNNLMLGNLRLLAFAYRYSHHSCPPTTPPPHQHFEASFATSIAYLHTKLSINYLNHSRLDVSSISRTALLDELLQFTKGLGKINLSVGHKILHLLSSIYCTSLQIKDKPGLFRF